MGQKPQTRWTPGRVRQVFALRATGETFAAIAKIMDGSAGHVHRIITRQVHANVPIPQNVLDKVNALSSYETRGAKPKSWAQKEAAKRKPVKPPTNGAMAQAMKDADPAYAPGPTLRYEGAPDPDITRAAHAALACQQSEALERAIQKAGQTVREQALGDAIEQGESPKLSPDVPYTVPQAQWEEMNRAKGTDVPTSGHVGPPTRAAALQQVLTMIMDSNKAQTDSEAALAEAERLMSHSRRLQDDAFKLVTKLKERGFSHEFLTMFLDESGLVGDGALETE